MISNKDALKQYGIDKVSVEYEPQYDRYRITAYRKGYAMTGYISALAYEANPVQSARDTYAYIVNQFELHGITAELGKQVFGKTYKHTRMAFYSSGVGTLETKDGVKAAFWREGKWYIVMDAGLMSDSTVLEVMRITSQPIAIPPA